MNESSAQALASANRHEGRKDDGAEDEDDGCARAADDDDGSDRYVSSRARTSALFFPRLPSTPLAFSTTARRLLLLHSSDRRVERDGRGDALTHARRQTRHAWVVLAATLQPGCGALRSSSSSSLSPVGVLVSRRLFGRRSVRSKRAARLHRDGGRARDARRGWFSPPESSRAVRARRGGLFFSCSSPVRSPVVVFVSCLLYGRRSTRSEGAGGDGGQARGARGARASPWVVLVFLVMCEPIPVTFVALRANRRFWCVRQCRSLALWRTAPASSRALAAKGSQGTPLVLAPLLIAPRDPICS